MIWPWFKRTNAHPTKPRRRSAASRSVFWRKAGFEWLEQRELLALSSTSPSATLTGLGQPVALAIDSSGDLFVANVFSGTVSKFLPGATTPSLTLNGFATPRALIFDSSGNLYVADSSNAVSKFAPNATKPSLTLSGVSGPDALAIDSSGNLYVANGTGNTVSVFLPGLTTASRTLIGLNQPVALAFDSHGNLDVANQLANTVSEFVPGSTTASLTLRGSLNGPDGLAFDSNDNLFVANAGSGTVTEFAPGSTAPIATLGGLVQPRSVMFDTTGDLFVANVGGNTVSEFLPGATTAAITLIGLNQPDALAFDSSGNLFVANLGVSTVSKFAAAGSVPVVTTSSTALTYTINSGAQVVDSGVTVTDSKSATIANATVAISSGYNSTDDTLGFTNQNGITGSFNQNSGILTLSGTSAVANYQAALRSVTFSSTSATASSSTRVVSFAVNDGTNTSNTPSRKINLLIASATHLVVTTQPPATVAAGAGFGLTVAVEDAAGNVVTGYSGTVTVALASNPGSSTLAGTLTANAINGVASFSGLSLNRVGTGYTLAVTSGTLASATSSPINVTPGSVTQLIVSGQPPASVTAATAFALSVVAEDAAGNVVPGFSGNVTAALASNPGGSTLGGTVTVNATNGVAVFSGLTLNKAGTGYVLSLASPGLTSVTTSAFNVLAGTPTQLVVISAFPTNVTVGAPFGFTAAAEDAEGNVATSFNGSVTVALATNPGGSTLGGTKTLSATNGLVVFSGLTLNNVASGYSLSVTTSSLTATSIGPFNVTALGVATHFAIQSGPPATMAPGAVFGVTVAAEDDFGSIDISFNGNVTLALASNPGASTLAGTLTAAASAGVATFSGLSLNNPGTYTLQATSGNLTPGVTNPFRVLGTLTINGTASSNDVQVTFTDATDFQVVLNGGAAASYSTTTATKFVYNAPLGTYSRLIFADQFNTYSATQSFAATDLVGNGFEFDANGVANLYVYASNGQSTATVNVASGTGSNFYVGVAALGYSYLGDPAAGIYSELSGFGSETITGSGGSTYAYVYSTSNTTFVGNPAGSSLSVSGFNLTLSNFPQSYAVGATDGTDHLTLDTGGGSFVGQPSFSYVSGTSNGNSFLIGALFGANVTAQASNPTDQAFFYSYPGNTFDGAPGSSSLTGSATDFARFATFVSQAVGFQSLTVAESGSGTDVANLTSPGNGVFTETGKASTLSVAGVTAITVNTFFNDNGTLVAVPSTVAITGSSTDTANLYDSAGSNSLVAQGSKATLTTPVNTVSVMLFGKVNAFQQSGTSDTVHQEAIDFVLQTIGNWTSV